MMLSKLSDYDAGVVSHAPDFPANATRSWSGQMIGMATRSLILLYQAVTYAIVAPAKTAPLVCIEFWSSTGFMWERADVGTPLPGQVPLSEGKVETKKAKRTKKGKTLRFFAFFCPFCLFCFSRAFRWGSRLKKCVLTSGEERGRSEGIRA
jgi:hypothetical protein